MRRIPTVLILVGLLFLAGCEYWDNRLHVINQYPSAIYLGIEQDTLPQHPDDYLYTTISPGDTSIFSMYGEEGWPFEVRASKNKALNMFIYQVDSMRKYHNMDTLTRRGIYRRISIPIEKLEANKWLVRLK